MARAIAEVMIKAGMPTLEEAVRRLEMELRDARRRGVGVLRLIHGYGSSGKGGKLRTGLRSWLAGEQEAGRVGRVVAGERWEIFDEMALGLLEDYPELRGDGDLGRENAGITWVEVKAVSGKR